MSEEMKNGNVSLAMEAQEPIVAEVDNDVALDIDVPNDIEITLDQPEVISQELSGDSAVGMIAGSLNLLAKDSTIAEESEKLSKKIDNIDLSPVEKKVEEVGSKIDNIKLPEIDTTELAKQGENQEATNSKILEEVQKIPNLKNIYSARFEKNDDGEDTYSMVLPIVAGVIANEDGETVTIKL